MGIVFSFISGCTAAAAAVVSATGFGPAGIAAGSVAASIQSTIGCVKAGSAFAAVQSLGASGALAAGGVTAGVAAVSSAAFALVHLLEKGKTKKI
mmetsp:Transcript_12305/g.22271  ORF Transcript_12305/g.22271 Transcript_12305/m.22271 type:complete len:95 (-) Transcript_12305:390-674(-)|eukprot:CAMPEP_0201638572 /NCGR_PEP_ID=MMETSP0493-20130528/16923_1 /ASSEMBLY_ACC=CAM_ASM_000838 /TAXON_ID=420259 /ORGANISM="Thalassiosira gravida, Strain GMp14c1" /LENGTH=94 /DNA_ID=CAMNT_0048111657 /DNA_START=54 /DNA_END=338 /DNA_ORIENTATION=+